MNIKLTRRNKSREIERCGEGQKLRKEGHMNIYICTYIYICLYTEIHI